MGWWERTVVPRVLDRALATPEVAALRATVCRSLEGRVLEVGFGSGLNVAHYPRAVREVAAVEPSDTAWRLAQDRVARSPVAVARTGVDGQWLAEPDGSFDCVLLTFVLCTIPDQGVALREARRVLRAGGTVHFVEHGRAPDVAVHRWQRRLEPVQRRLGGGCHLTRDPVEALDAAGLRVTDTDSFYLPGPGFSRPFGHVFIGTAEKPA